MRISQAGAAELPGLARLLWLNDRAEEPDPPLLEKFTVELTQWWEANTNTHVAYVARLDGPELVGMAWVALVPRVPRPGTMDRMSADIQSVYVMPEHRGQRIGSELVEAATDHAVRLGALRVTVHSGTRAVPVYERLGFASSRQLLQRYPD
ncbi:GNAT family N-acetyltransferase [Kribbella sp. NPDC048915]|uniref:GNAT family N-acetyltransferase n=1 Tax=Kribbella sp. NPDC048915 TaxID=3155148 RepID=UPI00340F4599